MQNTDVHVDQCLHKKMVATFVDLGHTKYSHDKTTFFLFHQHTTIVL